MTVDHVSTGVPGLDGILSGGYLTGCPTLIVGQPGCGKTLFLLQFLAEGAAAGTRVVCATCSEAPERLQGYMRALGHPVDDWLATRTLVFVDLRSAPGEIVDGPFDQEVVKVRLDAALTVDGAIPPEARLGLDDFNRLAYAFDPDGAARERTNALLRLLRESAISTVITAADSPQTRASLVDYAVDAVIELRQTVEGRLMTRTLRVPKMRGVAHGTNEYPFLIDEGGPTLMPITSLEGSYRSRERMLSTGHAKLDDLLGGGLYQGSSLLVSGTSGTGKSTLMGQLSVGLGGAGHRVVYVTFEQDETELVHDFCGVGLDVRPMLEAGTLRFERVRSVDCGLEDHLIRLARLAHNPQTNVIILDAVTALEDLGDLAAVKSMVLRLLDTSKSAGVTVILTELLGDSQAMASQLTLSSLLDAWIRLELHRQTSEFVRLIRVLKGRGANSSQQIKEFRITANGVIIDDPYVGPRGFAFGAEKLIHEQAERNEVTRMAAQLERLKRELDVLPRSFEARLAQTELERDEAVARAREKIRELETALDLRGRDLASILAERTAE